MCTRTHACVRVCVCVIEVTDISGTVEDGVNRGG